MTPDVAAFLKQLRSQPEIVAAARANPKLYGDMLRLHEGLAELRRAGQGDPRMRLLYDEVRLEAVRDERSVKQRLLRISEILAQARAGRR